MGAENGRREGRLPVAGTLRLLVERAPGLVLAAGEISDLSPGGCSVRVGHQEVKADLKGRIEVTVAGKSVSLPIVTRWVRADVAGRLVGCRFYELTVNEQRAIQTLIIETGAIAIESSAARRDVG